jgi:type IV pilus assembly protein PilO
MTYTEDFADNYTPIEDSFLVAPNYPKIFGITITPVVSGILIALIGIGGATWAFGNFVSPQLEKNKELEDKVNNVTQQIKQRQEISKQIGEAQVNLQKAREQKQVVSALFASDQKMDTILLDLNRVISARQGELQKFNPETKPEESGPVTDTSLGSTLTNKVKRKTHNVEVQGNFEQIQSILRTVERLDQLLLIKDFRADLDKDARKLIVDSLGNVIPQAQPEAKIKTSFKLQAIIPLTPEEQAAIAPPPPSQTPAKKN